MVPRSADKPATLVDVARVSGVSRWAVSAVLFATAKNRHVGVSEATRERILEAVERLRYRPHRASRGMQNRRHGTVGVLASGFFNIPWVSIDAMLRTASAHQQVLSFESLAGEPGSLPVFVRENVVDGLITFEELPPSLEREIARHRIPLVQVNTSDRSKPNVINMDEAGAMLAAAEHLSAQRYRQITLIVQKGSVRYEQERIAALGRACRRLGLPQPRILSLADGGHDLLALGRMMRDHLGIMPACDAVIAPHDGAIALVLKACQERRRLVPEHLGLICLQDPDRLQLYDIPVSGFALPESRLGELAIELLQRRITDPSLTESLLLTYALSIRASSLRA